MTDVTRILSAIEDGDAQAAQQLRKPVLQTITVTPGQSDTLHNSLRVCGAEIMTTAK